jgi:hypothetical protein
MQGVREDSKAQIDERMSCAYLILVAACSISLIGSGIREVQKWTTSFTGSQ